MTASYQLVGRGSSKDLYRLEEYPDHLIFRFSDRVSVFDYGALPDEIPTKGESLERVAVAVDKALRQAGLRTAYDAELSQKLKAFTVVAVEHPKFPQAGSGQRLKFIPLEVIFRWGVVPGSSLLKRRADLKPYTEFASPMVEYSTKLEASDRMIDLKEAAGLAGSREVLDRLTQYTEKCARVLRDLFKGMGLKLWDGKIECALDSETGEIVMVDAITPDEVRVTFPGLDDVPLSKELLRQWLGATPWSFEVARAKKAGGPDWKKALPPPPRLGAWRVDKLSTLYMSFADGVEAQKAMPLFNWLRHDPVHPKVYISGTGGREAALRWRLQREGAEIVDTPTRADAIFLSRDADLAAGMANDLAQKGHWVFGATRGASKLEWSKAFGREVAIEAGIPVPRFSSKPEDLKSFDSPPVVKCDGLAEGKGVVVPQNWEEAEEALKYWSAKGPILLEERLEGPEASAFFAIHSGFAGVDCRFLGTAKDFKRRFAGDEGPNTGGMGAYAPHPDMSEDDIRLFSGWAMSVAQIMARRNLPYNGILYMGFLKDKKKGWMLLEFNARPGDPETQALVLYWNDLPVLRGLLQLTARPLPQSLEGDRKVVCVSLVHPEYPQPTDRKLKLPEWKPLVSENTEPDLEFFRTSSLTGRVAYLVGAGDSYTEAGDKVFGALTSSPWKEHVEWRADLLP